MKYLYFFFTTLFFIPSIAVSQTSAPLSNEMKIDIKNLLPEKQVTVDIMDEMVSNPRQQELIEKFQAGIRNNYEWFIENLEKITPGEPMPYHQNLGLTETEYLELQNFKKELEIKSSETTSMIIEKENNIIKFKADGKLSILKTIRIDLDKNIVTIGEYELTFFNSPNITDESNALKSKWKGYTWKLEEPKNLDTDAFKDLESLTGKLYQLTIARLEKNGKTFMSLKGLEFQNGVQVVNFDIPIIF